MRLALLLLAVSAWGADAPSVTGITTLHHHGQTFITWTDPTACQGTGGATCRYDVYRSLSPITNASSLAAATKIQSGIFNNSGQQMGTYPYSQTTRQDGTKPYTIIQQGTCSGSSLCGSALGQWSGLAVHTVTAAESAYYAVITTDTTHTLSDSPVSSGNNATTISVSEFVASMVPLKLYDRSSGSMSAVSGKPLWVQLHPSSTDGGYYTSGTADQWVYWGNANMGYQDGIPSVFTLWRDSTGYYYGSDAVLLTPNDTVWKYDGTAAFQTNWHGYLWSDRLFHGVTRAKLDWLVPWTISNFALDTNRIYLWGQSMGAWGARWGLFHPEIFAAIFPAMPHWKYDGAVASYALKGYVPDMTEGPTQLSESLMMADGATTVMSALDAPAWVSSHCATVRPVIWGIGRQDGYASWQEQVDMVAALRSCKAAFAFKWDNGGHAATTSDALRAEYQTAYAKNVSHPAFHDFSLDQSVGTGDAANGDLVGCINCGWSWTVSSDTATAWSATISNSQISTTATADVTVRNAQAFIGGAGRWVSWASTNPSTSGTVTADSAGLVTVPLTIGSGGTTLTLTLQPNLFPLPSPIVR